jgi:hypothetical protein
MWVTRLDPLSRLSSAQVKRSTYSNAVGYPAAFLFPRGHVSKVTQATDELLAAFFRSAPSSKKGRISEQDWTNSLEKFHREARDIRQRLSLGVLARARVAFMLQQRLISEGFPADVVRNLVFTLLLNAFSGKG